MLKASRCLFPSSHNTRPNWSAGLREMQGGISLELDSLLKWFPRLIGPFDTQFSAVFEVNDFVASCLRLVRGCLC